MVAEALCALGQPEAVMPWLARYRERMQPRPAPGEPIRGDEWRARSAGANATPAGRRSFTRSSRNAVESGARSLGRAARTKAFGAAATHGLIRVGHAVRGIAERETPSRVRRELADALAGSGLRPGSNCR